MSSQLFSGKACSPLLQFVRQGHRLRGKPPGVAKTLAQRLQQENYLDAELHKRHDIGFPFLKPARSTELKQRLDHLKKLRSDTTIEKLARNKSLLINLDETKKDWLKTAGPFHVRSIADHYGVFEHLFGKHAYFTPRVNLDIKFEIDDETMCPVYYGNRIQPSETEKAPIVSFNPEFSIDGGKTSSKDSLWTLVLTNPDGHLTEQNQEYVHWMIGNIPNGDLSKGEIIAPYLQAFPPKGTGYHRHIFVLYKQEKKMDFSSMKVTGDVDLSKRTFNTFEFYRKHQDNITPAGLAFFQSRWDDSLTSFYHNVLKTQEPVYDYDYPEAYLKEQRHFPLKQPFNLYLDRYSDPKEVNKRYLEQRLAKTHPFEGPEPPLRFPNAQNLGPIPSWLKTDVTKSRLKKGRINDVDYY